MNQGVITEAPGVSAVEVDSAVVSVCVCASVDQAAHHWNGVCNQPMYISTLRWFSKTRRDLIEEEEEEVWHHSKFTIAWIQHSTMKTTRYIYENWCRFTEDVRSVVCVRASAACLGKTGSCCSARTPALRTSCSGSGPEKLVSWTWFRLIGCVLSTMPCRGIYSMPTPLPTMAHGATWLEGRLFFFQNKRCSYQIFQAAFHPQRAQTCLEMQRRIFSGRTQGLNVNGRSLVDGSITA